MDAGAFSGQLIAVLDDDHGRREHMAAVLSSLVPAAVVHYFESAPDMIAWLDEGRHNVDLYSLDHDLGPLQVRDGESFDPGTGRDVVEHLLAHCPPADVIVHSSNGPAATGMTTALELAGWRAFRVVPHGDLAWIEGQWQSRVASLLGE